MTASQIRCGEVMADIVDLEAYIPSILPSHCSGVHKKNELHPRHLFDLQNIRFRIQIQSLIQSYTLKNTTLIFLNLSTTTGTLQV